MNVADAVTIVAADHPALERASCRFLTALADQPRYFGPTAAANPKPFPSLIRALGEPTGIRLAALSAGQVVGIVRIDPAGYAYLAVAPDRRAQGVGTGLGRAALARAIQLGYTRVVLRSSRRSEAVRRVGAALGCVVVEQARGRIDLIVDLHSSRRSA